MKIFRVAALCSLMTAFAACTAEDSSLSGGDALPEGGNNSIREVTMTVSDFVPADAAEYGVSTRTSVTVDPSAGASFTWSEGDTVGIFPDSGRQVDFPVTAGAGSKTATFNGGGWALKTSSKYTAYYPFIGQMYLDKTSIPVTYPASITQDGNGNLAHLNGSTDYLVSSVATPSKGSVNLNFAHLGSFVELTLNMPDAGEVKTIELESANPWYTTAGTYNLTDPTPAIQAAETGLSKTFTINTTGITTTAPGEAVKVYFMMAPADLQTNPVKVKVNGCEATLPAAVMKAGKSYNFEVTPKSVPGFTKVVMHCTSGSYAKVFNNIGGNKSMQSTVSGSTNTWESSTPIPVFSGIASAQNRMKSIDVTYDGTTTTLVTNNPSDWTGGAAGYSATISGFKVNFTKGQSNAVQPTEKDGMKVYSGATLTIEYVGTPAQ